MEDLAASTNIDNGSAEEKQNYLIQHIIEPGYDASQFALYLSTKKGKYFHS